MSAEGQNKLSLNPTLGALEVVVRLVGAEEWHEQDEDHEDVNVDGI